MAQSINLETKEAIEKLASITDFEQQKKLVEKNPSVIIYASRFWHNAPNFAFLVRKALKKNPELILNFKNNHGLFIDEQNIETAVLSDPMIMFRFSYGMKKLISPEMFVKAFAKNPVVLTVKNLPCLDFRFKVEFDIEQGGEKVHKVFYQKLRTECLKAIRLSEGVSVYHEKYDDLAKAISKQIERYKNSFDKNKFDEKLLIKCATLMNVMIKKNNQQLRMVSPKAWLVNNGKPMYKAIRESAKKDSELEGLIEDMPTAMIQEKTTKKLIIQAILVNPEFYLKLDDYGMGKYKDDGTIKYNVYKSLKKHGMLRQYESFLTDTDFKKAKTKLQAVEKKKQDKKLQEQLKQEQSKQEEVPTNS